MNKIEETIIEIEEYLEDCKSAPFSGNRKILVDKDELQDLIAQLRVRTPDEIKKCQKIISNRDAILAKAKADAEATMEDARKLRKAMIDENDIKKDATSQANEIILEAEKYAGQLVNKAKEEAEAIRIGAMEYTDSLLAHVQEVIVNSLENYRSNYESMVSVLQADYETIMQNRNELISEDTAEGNNDSDGQPAQ